MSASLNVVRIAAVCCDFDEPLGDPLADAAHADAGLAGAGWPWAGAPTGSSEPGA